MNTVALPLVREVDPDIQAKMKGVFEEDLDFLREHLIARKLVAKTKVDRAILEYRKFICLVATGPRALPMYSKVVDEVWYSHILFTRQYMDFCAKTVGAYVHHQPTTNPVAQNTSNEFIELYERYFGPLPNTWANAQADCGGSGDNCQSCGFLSPPIDDNDVTNA